MSTISKQQVRKYINYIDSNINVLKINHRCEVLQMIIGSDLSSEKIIEKNNGTQIKYADLEPQLLYKIYKYIYNKLESNVSII